MPIDTRTSKRHPIQSSAEYRLHESMADTLKLNIPSTYIKSALLDIASSGCALESHYLIPINTLLKVNFDASFLKDEIAKNVPAQISAIGRVTSCAMIKAGNYRLGLCFTEISKEHAQLIDAFVQVQERRKASRWPLS